MSAFTPGPWYAPHFVDDTTTCNCRSVVCEFYAGAICTIHFDNGKAISDGGNDAPPLEEAKANAQAISALPDLIEALLDLVRCCEAHPAFTKPTNTMTVGRMDAARAALKKAGVL